MKKNILILAGITIVIVAVFATGIYFFQEPKFASLNITESGETIAGLAYEKQLNVEYANGKYFLNYDCNELKDFAIGKHCACKEAQREILGEEAIQIASLVEQKENNGEEAKCCDHAFQVATINYESGTKIEKIFFPDFVQLEGLACPGK